MAGNEDGRESPQQRSSEEKEYVAGLEKGLSIIEAFGIQNRAMTLSEAAEITGHTRASARRSLLTLQRLGYVEWDGKYFKLAPRVLRLGHAYVTSNPLSKIVQPILEALTGGAGQYRSGVCRARGHAAQPEQWTEPGFAPAGFLRSHRTRAAGGLATGRRRKPAQAQPAFPTDAAYQNRCR